MRHGDRLERLKRLSARITADLAHLRRHGDDLAPLLEHLDRGVELISDYVDEGSGRTLRDRRRRADRSKAI